MTGIKSTLQALSGSPSAQRAIVTTVSPIGLPGPPGADASISGDPENRIQAKPDGLFVPECTADPLAYYILASN